MVFVCAENDVNDVTFKCFLDPDVAEDMIDPMTSTDAISRKRQRNEICVTLKRSSIIHDVYIGKNCVEVIFRRLRQKARSFLQLKYVFTSVN